MQQLKKKKSSLKEFIFSWPGYVCLALLFVLFLTAVGNIISSLVSEQNQIANHKAHLAVLAEQLGQEIEQRISIVQSLAKNPQIINLIHSREHNKEINIILETVRADAYASLVYILDSNGTTLASTLYDDGKDLIGNNYGFRPYFQQAINGSTFVYPALGVTTNHRGLYVSTPIYTADGEEPSGVAVIKIGLHKIDLILKDDMNPKALVSPEGVIFASGKRGWLFHTLTPLSDEILAAFVESRQFADAQLIPLEINLTKRKVSFAHKTYFVARFPLSINGWYIISCKVYTPYFPLTRFQVILLILGFGIFALLGIIIFSLILNIHRRRKFEKALRDNEIRLQNILDNVVEWIWEVDAEGRYTYSNNMVKNVLGYEPSEILGKHYYALFTEEEKARLVPKVTELFSNKEMIFRLEHRNCHRDGHIVLIETTGVPILNEKGLLVGYRGIDRDITEAKQAEEQIRNSLQEKEVLLKEIHHRVKNNLQVIASLLNLQTGYTNDKEALEVFHTTQKRIRSMALIHESLYRSEDLAHIDLNNYVEKLVSNLLHSYAHDETEITTHFDIEHIFLNIDTAIPCGLIINELVSNSLKYAFPENRKGEISGHFSFNPEAHSYLLVIHDTGIGFPDHVDFRNTKSLGLQLVNILVQQLHGFIELEKKDTGTTFTITFPKS